MCCKLGKGNVCITSAQSRELAKFFDNIGEVPLTDYRKAVKSLHSEMERELREALENAQPILERAGERKAATALGKILRMDWEARVDRAVLFDLASGLRRVRAAARHNTLY